MINFETKIIQKNVEALSQNKIKQICGLHRKKGRDEQNLFLVEGEKIVLEVLNTSPASILYCVCIDGYAEPKNHSTISWFYTDEKTLRKCSTLTTPNKVIAIVKKEEQTPVFESFIIALDAIQDPGNMGTIIRMADWFGIKQIICSQNTVDFYNPKVIQASMGSFLRVKINYVNLERHLKETKLPIYGALLEGKNVYQERLKNTGILILGNEGSGISKEIIPLINHPITIPKIGGAESLNVSTASAILLSEFFRGSMI